MYAQKQLNRLYVINKEGGLENFARFTGKYLCWVHDFIKLQAFRPKILKAPCFYRTPTVAASENTLHHISRFMKILRAIVRIASSIYLNESYHLALRKM